MVSFLGAIAIALLAMALFNSARLGVPDGNTHVEPAKAAWLDIKNPLRFYALQSPEFGREPRVYEARRHRQGGGRVDTLSFGSALGVEPTLRISVYRFGGEERRDDRFFVEMARQASEAGLAVTHSAQPGDLATRFGVFETADLNMATGAAEVPCLGFRMEAATPGLRVSGYACGAPNKPIDRRLLACAIDRLDLVSAGDDQALARFFVTAELARGKACGGKAGPAQKSAWLEGKPVLKENAARENIAKR